MVIDDGLVPHQVSRRLRHTHRVEIGGRADHESRTLRDLPCRQRGIGELTHAQRHIYALFDEVDVPVIENDIDIEGGVLRQKGGKARHDVNPCEGDGRADAQTARQRCSRAARGEFGLVGFLDRPLRALIEIPARLGRRQTVSRTQQQTRAEPLLELRDRFGDGWLADTQLLGSAGERAGLDDADKGFHRGHTIHGYSLQE